MSSTPLNGQLPADMAVRIRRWLAAEYPFVIVMAALLAAVVYLLLFHGHWRRGVIVIAAAPVAAALFRGLLPPARAGMLVVRGRVRDTATMAVLGGVLITVAIRLH
ncbi:DUF3017 domain-containing protein [Jatrophihabitans sp.]|uniref:DUF3017 domain-containing protein n=1 Tax=Jatrophihabitans sp. TaxID=1932789 RepID=UPI0030C67F5C|nr:hypothetical protein [Jatrophihabitans sp.]